MLTQLLRLVEGPLVVRFRPGDDRGGVRTVGADCDHGQNDSNQTYGNSHAATKFVAGETVSRVNLDFRHRRLRSRARATGAILRAFRDAEGGAQRKNPTAFVRVIQTPQPMGIQTAAHASGTKSPPPASSTPWGAVAAPLAAERVCSEVASSCSGVI